MNNMNRYQIITDFCSDLTPELAKKLDAEVIPMEVVLEGEPPRPGNEIDVCEFYAKLRAKKSAQTSAVNLDSFLTVFEKHLAQGKDIIYIGISAGLSCTFAAAKLAAKELCEKYRGRKIYLVNSRSGSIGEGLAVYLAAEKQREGYSAAENYEYLKDICKRMYSEFTLNDLFFLKRGGRLSTATAIIGSMLALKPLIGVNEQDKLEVFGKARGRKNALLSLVASLEKLVDDPTGSTIAIGHSDCLEDAINLEMMIRAKWDVKEIIVADIGPSMGAHCGPDTVAIFFVKSPREDLQEETPSEEITFEVPELELDAEQTEDTEVTETTEA